MLATGLLLVFMFITNYMKLVGIRILKAGKVYGIFIIMIMKILFWLSIIEVVFIWAPKLLIFALPVCFLIFIIYIFMEKTLFYQAIKGKKEEAA